MLSLVAVGGCNVGSLVFVGVSLGRDVLVGVSEAHAVGVKVGVNVALFGPGLSGAAVSLAGTHGPSVGVSLGV